MNTDFVELAAQLHGCRRVDLLAFSEKEDRVAIILPNGQKVVYAKLALQTEKSEQKEESARPPAERLPQGKDTLLPANRPRSRAKKDGGDL